MKIKTAKYLQEKKLEAKRILKSIARQWFKIHKVKKITYVKGLYGKAWCKEKRLRIPPSTTRKRMYIIAHELGHLALHGHLKTKRSRRQFIKEYEAEQYAHTLMRRFNIKVPRAMTKRAKSYVQYRINLSIRRGLKKPIPKEITNWINV
tara:strand:- start:16 stop:462 length:447 start_codon:yes stop_codon:yes gene_type:complete